MTNTARRPELTGRFRPRLSLEPLSSHSFRLLFAGQAVSEFGNAFQLVALPLLVYQVGGDARQLGLVVAAYGVCRLAATPLGGMLADRWGAWRVMLISDIGRMLLTAVLAGVAARGIGDFVNIGLLAAGVGLCAGLFQPAAWAITPRLLPPDQLQAGNSLSNTVNFAAGLAGPGLAGLVVVFVDPAAALAVDALTFALSAACLVAIGRQLPDAPLKGPVDAPGPRSFVGLLRESPLLRNVLVVTAIANLTMGGMSRVGLPALASQDFAAGAIGLGALLSAFTGGCLVGGLVTAGLTDLRHRGATAMSAGLVMAVAVALIPFTGLAGAMAMLLVAGAASTMTNVLIITVVQKGTAPALLGRVMAAIMFCALGLFPLSVAAAGVVVTEFGSRSVFVATGLLLLCAFAFGLSRQEIRSR